MKAIALLVSFLVAAGASHLGAASVPPNFTVADVGGTWNQPAGVMFETNGTGYVWERGGKVYIVENDVKRTTPLIDISDEVGAWVDHGMLGFALHPNFRQNGYIYLLYVVDHHHLAHFGTGNYNPNANEYNQATIGRLTRYTARASDNFRSVDPASRTVLIGETASTGFPILWTTHGIGSLVFGRDGTLLVSCGDGSGMGDYGSDPNSHYVQALNEGIITARENVGAFRCQMINSMNGKILRIDPLTGNGIPSNPFYDGANPRSAKSRMWALGLRNPFRVSLRPGSGSTDPAAANPGVLYIGDVGYDDWEELSVCTGPGQNFGWPIYEGFSLSPHYLGGNPENPDAPNPLFGVNGCTQQYFRFRDLLIEATLGTPSWPNPCNTSQQIPANAPRFMHRRPAMDWKHLATQSRCGTFSGNNATVADIGAPGAPVTGPQFGGECSVGGFWYTGTSFPTQYRNTYLFADFVRGWIRSASFDTNNNLLSVRDFVTGVVGIGSLAAHPLTGNLYYVRIYDGVEKISFVGSGNQPPVATASSDKLYGIAPLTVQFTGSGSSDPEGLPLTYSWNFGDGTPVSTQANPVHVFNAPPGVPTNYTAVLTVTDNMGAPSSASVSISVNNTPPTVAIVSPMAGTRYPMTGDTTYDLIGQVSDNEQSTAGLLYEWEVSLHHDDHKHTDPVDTNHVTTTTVSPIGCDGHIYYYRIVLKVTDSAGLSTSADVIIPPDCPNTPPTLSSIADQTISLGSAAGPLGFTVGDMETIPGALQVSGSSSNPALVPDSNIVFDGSGANRTVTVTPAGTQTGSATITVTVSDGELTASKSFVVNVSSAPTYILTEGFEGAGYENTGWAEGGTPNEDYAVAPLHGTQSLNLTGGQYVFRTFRFTDKFYLYFRAKWNVWSAYNNVLYWDTATWGTAARCDTVNNRLDISHGTVDGIGTTVINLGTTYHVWIEWTKGTGANGTMKLFVSTDGVKPASPEASITTGNGAATERMYVGPFGAGPNMVLDRFLVDDVPILSQGDGPANQPPTISDIASQTIPENGSTGLLLFTVADPDTAVGSLTLSGTSSSPVLVPNGNIVFGGSGANRNVTVTPAAGQSGSATITVTVSDGTLTDSDTFDVVVTPAVNTPPSITDVTDRTINEDTNTGAISFTIGDGETPSSGLTMSGGSSNPGLVPNGNIVFGGGGASRNATVTPLANQFGSTTITLTVSDGVLTGSDTFVLTVNPVNDAPTISGIADQTTVTNVSAGPINFTVGDVETAAGSLTLSGTSGNTTLIPHGNIAFGGSGANRNVTVTPAAGQTGTATVTVTVSDGDLSAIETFDVTVNAIIPPTYLLSEGFEGAGYENSGWSEGGTPNEDYTAVPLDGAQSVNLTGGQYIFRTFRFTDRFNLYFRARWNTWANFNNVLYWDTATWGTACRLDAAGGHMDISHGSVASVGTTVINPNTTYHIWIEWTKGTGANGTMKLFVSTDGVKPAVPEASLSTGTGGATERIYMGPFGAGPNVIFDSILLDDVPIGSNPAGGQNQPPTISNIANQTIPENGSTGLLDFTVGDPETAAGSLTLSGTSSNPTLVPNGNIAFGGSGANRNVNVTPAAGQSGSATITVTVSDGTLTASDTFDVVVTPAVNTPPSISNVTDRTINEDANTGAIQFSVGDSETAAGSLTMSGSSSNPTLVPNGNIVFGGSGSSRNVTVGPAANQFGSATITLTVSDGVLTSSDTFVLTVNSVNDAPTITAIADQSILMNTATPALSFTIGDVETAAGSLTVTGTSANQTLVPDANIAIAGPGSSRTVTVTPAAGQTGTATITLTVSDGNLTATEVFVVTVNAFVPPTYLLTEGFEGTGYENAGWLEGGTPNEDYTATALDGTQSLNLTGGQYIVRTFRFTDRFNLYFRARWNAWTPYNNIMFWDTPTWSTACRLDAGSAGIDVTHGAATSLGTTVISPGTTYHIWVEWTKGTGSNGTMKLFISTNGVKPAQPEASLSAGTGGATENIYIGPLSAGPNVIIDRLLVDDVEIGSNP